MKPKLISLPRYYVTHFINVCEIGDCPLPDFVEVTDMYVKVRSVDVNLGPISKSAEKDMITHPSPTVRKSAQRTYEKIKEGIELAFKHSPQQGYHATITHQNEW